MELAPWQGERLRSEARARGFTEVEVRGDLTGLVRFVVARWPGR